MDGSKSSYEDMVLSLYYDLIITPNDGFTYDKFYLENIYNVEHLESRLKLKLGVMIEVI